MHILTVRTDKPISELGLYDNKKQLDYIEWEADRKLAETISIQIKQLMNKNGVDYSDLGSIIVYEGPGSFTGLRIGISVANALAQGLSIPIVSTSGDDWIEVGQELHAKGDNQSRVKPEYGALPHITLPKK